MITVRLQKRKSKKSRTMKTTTVKIIKAHNKNRVKNLEGLADSLDKIARELTTVDQQRSLYGYAEQLRIIAKEL